MPAYSALPWRDGGDQRPHGLVETACRGRSGASRRCRRSRARAVGATGRARRAGTCARPEVAVGPGPHVVAGLGRDDQLVAVGGEVGGEHAPEVLLGRPVGRAVVVGQVEVGDAEIERPPADRLLGRERPVVAEVVPQPERDGRQQQPAGAAPAIRHRVVAVLRRHGAHRPSLRSAAEASSLSTHCGPHSAAWRRV